MTLSSILATSIPRRLSLSLAAALPLALGCAKAPETLPAAPAAPAESRRDVFLFLGDSLTAGYGIAAENAFPALLEELWAREKVPFRTRNAGVSGATTAGVLETLDWTLAPDVHTAFVCIGANDGLRGLDLAASRKNLDAILTKVRARGARVVLAGMKLPPNYGRDYTRRFESLYPELARRHGAPLMPFLLDGVAGRSELNLPDGIHPNENGHARIAENVHSFLSDRSLLR